MRVLCLILFLTLVSGHSLAAPVDPAAINDAQWEEKTLNQRAMNEAMVKLQIMLDRAHFSPGEIDGKAGENVEKALRAFRDQHNLASATEVWSSLADSSKEPVIVEYKIAEADVKGPFAEKIPAKMEDQKDLPSLAYTSAKEKIFHMSVELLIALNPGSQFKAGDKINVANVSATSLSEKAARIEIDKTKQMLTVFGKSEKSLAVYPVTAGSTEKPAPNGQLKVTSVAKNPTYRYNPDYAFKGVKSRQSFTIKPGPNNPVGVVWIGLNKEGYGIHGTPDPTKVGKSESHGCIRLTNWDALQLAEAVGKGVPVEFVGDEKERDAVRAQTKSRRGKR